MAMEKDIPVEDRLLQLINHLGLDKVHMAARIPRDWQPFATAHPDRVASLTLVCPRRLDSRSLTLPASRLMVVTGDQGRDAESLQRSLQELPRACALTLADYQPNTAADVVAERQGEIGGALLNFLSEVDQEDSVRPVSLPQGEGQVAGVLYRVHGSGPPLLLMPLQYSPSQWDPLLDRLSQTYSTIVLGGPNIGSVFNLEARSRGGYLEAVARVVKAVRLQPGEPVLDVGCGPGSLDRWLAHCTGKANPITGLDPSAYLLREAAAMARSEGLEGVVDFQEGSGDLLPFPDASFDAALSFTAIQFLDADRMLTEMLRVTRPLGRMAVLARGDDRPNLVNVPLRAELKARIEGQRNELHHEGGCNDASLYRRFHQAGLTQVKMFPQLAVFTPATDGERLQDVYDRFTPLLNPKELEEYRSALDQALADGSFFIAEWFHCAVGTKAA